MPQKTVTLSSKDKLVFIEIIKSLDLKESDVPNEKARKWYRFGAYDSLRTLTEDIKNTPEPKTRKSNDADNN